MVHRFPGGDRVGRKGPCNAVSKHALWYYMTTTVNTGSIAIYYLKLGTKHPLPVLAT